MTTPRLTLGIVRDIREQTGVDILRVGEPAVWARMQTDLVWQGRAIAIAGGPHDLAGDALTDAVDAFFAAVVEFFPRASAADSDADPPDGSYSPWHAVFKMAGVTGLDPYPLTLRELWWAAEGAWEPQAEAIAAFYAAHAGKGTTPPKPADINPYARTGRTVTRGKRRSQKAS